MRAHIVPLALAFGLAASPALAGELPREVALDVKGLKKGSEKKLRASMKGLKGVQGVDVDGKAARVYIRFDGEKATAAQVLEAAKKAGLSAELTAFHLRGTAGAVRAKVGKPAKVGLVVGVGRDDAYVHPDAPFKIKLRGSELGLSKTTLRQTDGERAAKDGKAKMLSFEVPIAPTRAGQHKLEADLSFFYCTPEVCERKKAKVAIPVEAGGG